MPTPKRTRAKKRLKKKKHHKRKAEKSKLQKKAEKIGIKKNKGRTVSSIAVVGDANTYTESITPDQATNIIENDNFVDQRILRDEHSIEIAQAMQMGRFPPSTQLCFAVFQNKKVIVDGQHRLWAVILSGITTEFVCTYYPVDREEQIRELYAEMDQGKGRGPNEIYKAQGLHKELGLTSGEVNKIGTAAPHVCACFQSRLRNKAGRKKAMRIKFIRDHAEAANVYFEAIGSGVSGHVQRAMRRAPIMAVGLVTCFYQPDRAGEFWSQVSHPHEINERDARNKLREYILAEKSIKRTPEEWSRLCANAWNTWLKGKHVQSLSIRNPGKPIRIDRCRRYGGASPYLPYGDFSKVEWVLPKKMEE